MFALLEGKKQKRLSASGTVVKQTTMWLHYYQSLGVRRRALQDTKGRFDTFNKRTVLYNMKRRLGESASYNHATVAKYPLIFTVVYLKVA
jgi:hypothetical protein